VITHNQGRYIRQCLQSIVDQETDFDYELIVGDDLSTDGTRLVVEEFALRYPNLVRPILHDRHVGGTANLLSVYSAARGEYVAHVDGDDYMLPGKLATQARELDGNPDCAVCVHRVLRLDQRSGRQVHAPRKEIPRKADLPFLLMNLPYFAHSSKMFRRASHAGLDDRSEDLLDCFFHVHHARNGKILHLDQVLGVYRMNVGTGTDAADRRNTRFRKPSPTTVPLVLAALEYARRCGVDPVVVQRALSKFYLDRSFNHLMARDLEGFRSYIHRSRETARLGRLQQLVHALSWAAGPMFVLVRARSTIRGAVAWTGAQFEALAATRRRWGEGAERR
jgi:glycosyltransferase involved in cell wall biosynthesis